jgi:hypothetical protein
MNDGHVSRTSAAVVLASRSDEKHDNAVGRQHDRLADPYDAPVAGGTGRPAGREHRSFSNAIATDDSAVSAERWMVAERNRTTTSV